MTSNNVVLLLTKHILILEINKPSRVKDGRKCLYNYALNTCYLQLYGIGHKIAKGHSEREMKLAATTTWDTIFDKQQNIFYATDMIMRATAFVTPVLDHWLERENSMSSP